MEYGKNKGRSKGKFVMVRHDMMESEAWHDLSPYARSVWLVLMKRYNSYNNGDIPLGVREAAQEGGMSKGKAKDSLDELIDKGFLKITIYSSFTCKMKRTRRWSITHEFYNKKPPSNEWRKWKKIEGKI